MSNMTDRAAAFLGGLFPPDSAASATPHHSGIASGAGRAPAAPRSIAASHVATDVQEGDAATAATPATQPTASRRGPVSVHFNRVTPKRHSYRFDAEEGSDSPVAVIYVRRDVFRKPPTELTIVLF